MPNDSDCVFCLQPNGDYQHGSQFRYQQQSHPRGHLTWLMYSQNSSREQVQMAVISKSPNPLIIHRSRTVQSTMAAVCRPNFCYSRLIEVESVGEEAQDYGGQYHVVNSFGIATTCSVVTVYCSWVSEREQFLTSTSAQCTDSATSTLKDRLTVYIRTFTLMQKQTKCWCGNVPNECWGPPIPTWCTATMMN